jgi:hypothetical protein
METFTQVLLERQRMDRDSNSTSPRRYPVAVRSPAGEALLWEFLYDSGRDGYLCLSFKAPLVCYVDLSLLVAQLPAMPPLGILGMGSSLLVLLC